MYSDRMDQIKLYMEKYELSKSKGLEETEFDGEAIAGKYIKDSLTSSIYEDGYDACVDCIKMKLKNGIEIDKNDIVGSVLLSICFQKDLLKDMSKVIKPLSNYQEYANENFEFQVGRYFTYEDKTNTAHTRTKYIILDSVDDLSKEEFDDGYKLLVSIDIETGNIKKISECDVIWENETSLYSIDKLSGLKEMFKDNTTGDPVFDDIIKNAVLSVFDEHIKNIEESENIQRYQRKVSAR